MMPSKRSLEAAKRILKEMEDEAFTLYESAFVGKLIEVSTEEKRYECEKAVLNSFSVLLPQMTESEKEALLAFGEGMALVHRNLKSVRSAV